ncbi:MAG: nucleotide exchange factor GrpE [Ignavibacteria bacterium]|nr:nucleotide exchange factor GrpE [Ignavibacteria bacterium]
MEDKSGHHKPLRQTSNSAADIAKTYLKDKGRMQVSTETSDGDKFNHIFDDEKLDSMQNELGEEQQDLLIDEDTLKAIKQFEEIIKERDELKEQVKRIAAELENFRRRSIKEKQDMIDYANERLLLRMLPLVDDMETALGAGKKTSDIESLLSGIELIYKKVLSTLEEAGVKQMENPIGTEFDVNFQEAIATVPSELPEGYVAHIIQPGYMLHEKVLRYARVVTSVQTENQNIQQDDDVS